MGRAEPARASLTSRGNCELSLGAEPLVSLPPSNLIPPGSKFGHTILADLDIRTLARCRETVQYLSNTGYGGSFRRTTSAFERETRVSVNIDCEASACNGKSSQVRKKKLYKGFFVARFRF